MLISRSRRFIFVHIPKSAGTSIAAALEKYCRPSLLRRALNRAGLWNIPGHPPHSSALKIRELLRPDFFDACFKFAFVRNPWDWHVSLYHYALQTSDPRHASVRASRSFDRYIEWRTAAASAERSSLQKSYIVDEQGKLLVDWVGRYERLEQDFAAVCRRINVRETLPRLNVSLHGSYREHYTDRTRRLVEEAYTEDIEMFGYEF